MDGPTQKLPELIKDHLTMTGKTQSQLAKASGLSRSRIGQLISDDIQRIPRLDTLEKLARGLNLPLTVVKAAALTSVGLSNEDTEQDLRVEIITRRLSDLPDEDLAYIDIFVSALIQRRHG